MSELYDVFNRIISSEQIQTDIPMKEHTTFKIGGNASFFLSPHNIKELAGLKKVCFDKGITHTVLGNGSNVLVMDSGYNGAIISTKKMKSMELVDNVRIKAQAGVVLSKLANFALDNDLAGLEFASGIPGTLGGAVYMNAGAYGGEITDVFESASVVRHNGDIDTVYNSDMRFAYRNSALMSNGSIAAEVIVRLEKGHFMDIKDKMLDLNKRRAEKQPIDMPSAGSAFKRPVDGFASKLIMEAGLQGYSIGGAQISEKHCGFIVNTGGATSDDVLRLVEYIQDIVFKMFNIALEPEFRVIGSR